RPPRKSTTPPPREIRPPQDPRHQPPLPRKLQADVASIPGNAHHPPQNLLFIDRRVIPSQGISPRDELPSVAPHNAMRHKASPFGRGRPDSQRADGPGEGILSALPLVQHNLPVPELRKTLPANRKEIARPHQGQHAVPRGLESNLPEFASNLHQQLAMSR